MLDPRLYYFPQPLTRRIVAESGNRRRSRHVDFPRASHCNRHTGVLLNSCLNVQLTQPLNYPLPPGALSSMAFV